MSKQKSFQNKTGFSGIEAKNGGVDFFMPKIGVGGHGGFHNHDDQAYNFTFSSDLGTVESMARVLDTTSSTTNTITTQTLNITNATFKTVVGLNDQNVQAVLDVVQSASNARFASTRIYNDKDGDGQYTESFDIQVATGSSSIGLRQQTFTFNDDGTITATVENFGGRHNPALLEQNATLKKVTLDGVAYVTKTVADVDGTGYHFDVFRDDNGDGVWTQIAQGETLTGVDATTSAIDLVGIQSYLASASTIVG